MWVILEHKNIGKTCKKLPLEIVKKYELWKDIIFRHGPDKLQEFPGFHDEKLKGKRKNERSSRLSIKYRVIYKVEKELITVYVFEINPHKY